MEELSFNSMIMSIFPCVSSSFKLEFVRCRCFAEQNLWSKAIEDGNSRR